MDLGQPASASRITYERRMWRRRFHRVRWHATTGAVLTVMGVCACGSAEVPPGAARSIEGLPSSTAASGVDSVAGSGQPGAPRLVVLGDSLTAGLGLDPEQGFPARLQARLDSMGYDLRVVSAGVSGDTTAGALRRLDWALEGDAEILIVALGGNDGLRGLPVEQMKDNLAAIITTAEARGVEVLLAGMEAPPNFGPDYTNAFRDVFDELAKEYDIAFVPFLLEGVAGVPGLNQSDGIHPNADGAERVAAHLWPTVESLVQAVSVEAGP